MDKIKKAADFHRTAFNKQKHFNTKSYSHKKRFDRTLLPNPLDFYRREFFQIKCYRNNQATVNCCFHHDKHPSMSINLNTGSCKCFACGAYAKNIVDFYIKKYSVDFKTAVQALGAWKCS